MAQANIVLVSTQKSKSLNSACGIISNTLQEENLHWNLNYTNGKFTKLKNSPYCFIFSNLSLIANVIEIQNKKSINIQFRELDLSEPGR